MKKIILLSISVGIILFTTLFISCEDNQGNECSTCNNENYKNVKANLVA